MPLQLLVIYKDYEETRVPRILINGNQILNDFISRYIFWIILWQFKIFFFLINTKFQRVYIKKRSYEPVNHNFSQIIWQNMLLSFVAQLGASNIFNGDL